MYLFLALLMQECGEMSAHAQVHNTSSSLLRTLSVAHYARSRGLSLFHLSATAR